MVFKNTERKTGNLLRSPIFSPSSRWRSKKPRFPDQIFEKFKSVHSPTHLSYVLLCDSSDRLFRAFPCIYSCLNCQLCPKIRPATSCYSNRISFFEAGVMLKAYLWLIFFFEQFWVIHNEIHKYNKISLYGHLWVLGDISIWIWRPVCVRVSQSYEVMCQKWKSAYF